MAANLATARHLLELNGPLSLAQEPVTWDVTEQNGTTAPASLRPLLVGGKPVPISDDPSAAVPVVDQPAVLTQAMITLFQRAEDGRFVRIATSVQQDGHRAIRTAIAPTGRDGAPNPVLAEILAGRTYQGLAWVVDRWRIASYAPLSVGGRVEGMLFAGQPVLDAPALTANIHRQHFGASGYAFVVDPAGRVAIHHKTAIIGKHIIDDLVPEG